MSTQHETSAAFQPAFCHRRDCAASPETPFCSGCGADIAAYLDATTAAHEAVRLDDAVTQVTSVARELNGARERSLWTNGSNGSDGTNGSDGIVDAKPLVRLPAREAVPVEVAAVPSPAAPASWRDWAVIASFTAATVAGALAAVAADLV